MTDKPDVAALTMTHLLSWLPGGYTHCRYGTREWCEGYLNNARDVIEAQAAELTRLAAENRTYAEAHAFNSERFAEMLLERDEAKAEIARLHRLLREIDTHVPVAVEGDYADDEPIMVALDEIRATLAALKPDTGEMP